MTMGEKIKIRRKELNLSLRELSKITGVSHQSISQWENGAVSNARLDNINSIATALKVSPMYLICDDEEDINAMARSSVMQVENKLTEIEQNILDLIVKLSFENKAKVYVEALNLLEKQKGSENENK